MKSLKGTRVGVLGLARSGIAAANLARSLGANVLVSEIRPAAQCKRQVALLARGVESECGRHSKGLLDSDIIVKSPGIHNDIAVLKEIRSRKIPVWSEIEFASRLIAPQRIVAITGTNGKTTTTTLVGGIFKAAGGPTIVAGNIGSPLAALAKKVTPRTTVVLEVSSYQLEDSPSFHPHVSALLNITPDHLEHHHTMKNYIRAKTFVFANQTKNDFCVLNYDDAYCRKLAARCPASVIFLSRIKPLARGVFYRGGRIHVRLSSCRYDLSASLKIPGRHNIENALAATAIAAVSGVNKTIIEKVITGFPGVEHRIELSRELDGVKYFNDSKATNVDSTLVALESFSSPVWLILGGRDKGSPYTPLRKPVKRNVRGILLIGEAAPKIKKGLAGLVPFYECGTLKNAVRTGARLAASGDAVLLSPACASFDQFSDYEDRGRQFKKFVRDL